MTIAKFGVAGVEDGADKWVLELALECEITDYLGYDKHDPGGRAAPACGLSRQGSSW